MQVRWPAEWRFNYEPRWMVIAWDLSVLALALAVVVAIADVVI